MVVVLERAKVEVLAQAVTAFLKKPRDEKVLVEVDSAHKAVTANKRMAGTVAARVHLVSIKVLAEEAEVLVEITRVQVLHVVSAVEDLAKAAALGKILTKSKMALEVECLVQKVVVALEAAEGFMVVVVVVVAALVRAVVVVLGEVEVALEEVVVFQEVMMGRMVVAEVVALVVVVVVDVIHVVKMVTLQETVLKRRVVVEELVIAAVKRDT